MSTKLSVQHVYKVFGAHPRRALDRIKRGESKDEIFAATGMTVGVSDASFEVQEGEIFVVMGLSGSGKSTLVRMLNRLIDPTAGAIRIDGQDITRMTRKQLIELRRREISMVFQSFALMPHQSVLENTAFGLAVAGTSRSQREEKALAALDAVGLKANAHSYPDELSGGMKQRVGLARALAVNPGILLMDEAFSALDPLIRTEMQDELLRLQSEQARTVVFITHDLDEAMRVGDRIAIMQGGAVVQVGTPEEIVREPANEYVRSFFRGVDVSHVFTAADVARKDHVTVMERPGVSVRAALERLREHDGSAAVVHDRSRKYQGVVSIDSLIACIDGLGRREEGRIEQAFVADVTPVTADTPLTELMTQVAESPYPVPVVDGDGRYQGTISRATLLHTLNRTDKGAA
ncbi:glycine betaine/L-proline ABC transporter ATP-binding protein ProV [Endozoicomonas sp. G2_2]|uniref:glycine betaine/L-proline ABC transporter ATP-binding protein ProV n=1 Tax=Endozoicomonas sp. G2_2 TaxID=2821092 RepID=UPI001AD9847F|nr:glycine betaine/L-proline ABC transporter ATP-binding protein ProV [Endozoicomonas sp. G2_2]MBO9469522.1 glycine betaine/L-proline ABC transporter ATP-binding protein ProV [Endozoicomonas sp. G2_2]